MCLGSLYDNTENDMTTSLPKCESFFDTKSICNIPVSRGMLIKTQKEDSGLSMYFNRVEEECYVKNAQSCYYVQNGVLMRKFRPVDVPADASWADIHQIVIPSCYRNDVLELAHDGIGGHQGVNKTYHKIYLFIFFA